MEFSQWNSLPKGKELLGSFPTPALDQLSALAGPERTRISKTAPIPALIPVQFRRNFRTRPNR